MRNGGFMEISINIIKAVNNNKYVNMKDYKELVRKGHSL